MSEDKKLPMVQSGSNVPQLHNSGIRAGSIIEQALARLNPEQAKTLVDKATDKALELEAQQRKLDMEFEAGKKDMQLHINAFDALDKNGRTVRQTVTSDIKTGTGRMRVESKSGAACFVATATYEDPDHPDVVILRLFRDKILVRSIIGRVFISAYWNVGPILAIAVRRSEMLRAVSRILISKLAQRLRVLNI